MRTKPSMTKFDKEVQGFIELCFVAHHDKTRKEIAKLSGLSYSTVSYLLNGRVSRRTHMGTVQKLGHSVGLRLEIIGNNSKIKVIE